MVLCVFGHGESTLPALPDMLQALPISWKSTFVMSLNVNFSQKVLNDCNFIKIVFQCKNTNNKEFYKTSMLTCQFILFLISQVKRNDFFLNKTVLQIQK